MGLSYKFVKSPIGNLKLVASEQGVVAILWEKDRPQTAVEWGLAPAVTDTDPFAHGGYKLASRLLRNDLSGFRGVTRRAAAQRPTKNLPQTNARSSCRLRGSTQPVGLNRQT